MDAALLNMQKPSKELAWHQYAFALFLPALCMSISHGASLLALPLIVRSWGMQVANVAYLHTVKEISELVANVPASTVLIRCGPRGARMFGAALYGAIALPLAFAPSYAALALLFLIQGVIVKIYMRGESSVLKSIGKRRGQASSVLTACRYCAMALSPNLTALLQSRLGGAQRMYLLQAGLGIAMVFFLSFGSGSLGVTQVPPLAETKKGRQKSGESIEGASYSALLRDPISRHEILITSSMCAFVSVLRGSYNLMIPLVGLSVGFPATVVSASMTLTFGVAFALSIPAGKGLDAFGRKACAAASMGLFALGHSGLGLAAAMKWGDAAALPSVSMSAVLLGAADSLSSSLGRAMKGDAAAREEARLEQLGWPTTHIEMRVAFFFALLDIILDAIGIFYPIVLGVVATHISMACASYTFAIVACFATVWVRIVM